MKSNCELSRIAHHNEKGLSEQLKYKKRKSKPTSKFKKYINSCGKTQNKNKKKLDKEMKQQALQYFSENYDKHKQSLIELFYLIYE
tara:strand:+ start:92 stop:349 length:258 start_codon:yes stop_codon:yes gene_type:complete